MTRSHDYEIIKSLSNYFGTNEKSVFVGVEKLSKVESLSRLEEIIIAKNLLSSLALPYARKVYFN